MLTPKKSLGQNFLQDANVLRRIAEAIAPQTDDAMIEIGPGTGALTRELVQSGAAITAIELDPRAVQLLTDQFAGQVSIVQSDVLKIDLRSLATAGKRFRIAGNIPYYITSDILFWLFDQYEAVQDATLMMQLEVAQRLTAVTRTKEYGILSVFTDFYCVPEFLFKVSRNSFYPKPNVDSAVVQLHFKRETPPCDLRMFKNVVRSTFGMRRKTLRNGLKSMGLSGEQLDTIPYNLTKRPEELSSSDFLELAVLVSAAAPSLHLKFNA